MKIVFVSPHSDPEADLGEPDSGGQCIYEHQLATQLSELGHEVITFCRDTGVRESVSRINDRYRIERIAFGKEGFIRKEELFGMTDVFVDMVAKRLEGVDVDVIHGHYWDGGATAVGLRAVGVGQAMVWTPHSLGFAKRQRFKGRMNEYQYNFVPRIAWENYAAQLADVVLCHPLEDQSLVRHYGVDAKRIRVVKPGVELKDFRHMSQNAARKKLGLPTRGKLLVCLGRLSKTKGYSRAIRVLPYVDADLVIVGGNLSSPTSEERAYLELLVRTAESLGVRDRVHFVGALPHDEVSTVYHAADAFLMTSKKEPFGLTVLESMACSTPVIASNSGGPKEMITHTKDGLLVDWEEIEMTGKQIALLLKSPTKLKELALSAKETVDRYRWQHRVHDYVQHYEEALGVLPMNLAKDWRTKMAVFV